MSTFGKVLLVFSLLAAIPLFYLAARALKTHQAYRSEFNAYQKALSQTTADILKVQGDDPQHNATVDGLRQVTNKLNDALSMRGRAWYGCIPQQVGGDGSVSVQVPAAGGALEIAEDNVLNVFEQVPDGVDGIGDRSYLGEFKVTAVDAQNSVLTLSPTGNFLPIQRARVNRRQAPWALYEAMPSDSHIVWDGVDKADIAKFVRVPPGGMGQGGKKPLAQYIQESVSEIQRNGTPPKADDPGDRVVMHLRFLVSFGQLDAGQRDELAQMGFAEVNQKNLLKQDVLDMQGRPVTVKIFDIIQKDGEALFVLGKPDGTQGTADRLIEMQIAQEVGRFYYRPLRDYSLQYRELFRLYPELDSQIQGTRRSLTQTQSHKQRTDAAIQKENVFKAELTTETTRLSKEIDVVEAYEKQLAEKVANYRQAIKDVEAENQDLARRVVAAQLREAKRIEKSVPTSKKAE